MRVSQGGLHFRRGAIDRLIPWREINCVVAETSVQLIGDTHVLLFELATHDVAVANDTDLAWSSLLEELHLQLPGAKRAATWRLELVASGRPVEVYRR